MADGCFATRDISLIHPEWSLINSHAHRSYLTKLHRCGSQLKPRRDMGVSVPPSPPVNSPIRHFWDLPKASENNASGLPECASVEACIPQCSPQSSPTEKCIRAPRAPAQRAGAGADLSGASAFHVFLPDQAPLKPCSRSAVMRSYSGATWGASASRGAAAGLLAEPRYVRGPLVDREPSFLETAIQFDLRRLIERADRPG
jgi:hypothetical protein